MAIPCLRKIGKTTCSITLLLLVFFLGPSSLGAQGKSLSSHKRAGRKSRVEFHGHKQRAGNFRGRRQDGALVWSQSFGMADLENFVPATSLTCIIHKSGAPKSFFVRVNNHEMASEFG
jgi:hypothetical protein